MTINNINVEMDDLNDFQIKFENLVNELIISYPHILYDKVLKRSDEILKAIKYKNSNIIENDDELFGDD